MTGSATSFSFNQGDCAWATWIAWVLEEAYSVLFQDWDLRHEKDDGESRACLDPVSPHGRRLPPRHEPPPPIQPQGGINGRGGPIAFLPSGRALGFGHAAT